MNQIRVPKDDTEALTRIIAGLEAQGVAYNVELIRDMWRIEITGC